MFKRLLIILGVIVVAIAGVLYAIAYGWFGNYQDAGKVEGKRIPDAQLAAREAGSSDQAPQVSRAKQILFGDLHVHTTFSADAFNISLPVVQGEGAHPVADACDFARYCSALDFWSITDHVEGMTPRQWTDTKNSIRACNASAGDPKNPDMVSFLGWEWTQIGSTPENHFGHKNVILRDIDEDKVPTRPIAAESVPGTLAALGRLGPGPRDRLVLSLLAPGGNRQRYFDFAKFVADRYELKVCPKGVPERQLPADCMEQTATPDELFAKLHDWGFPALVIPHGSTWGLYTPQGTTFDKQLSAKYYDPSLVRLIEIYSGHGNSEQYRPWSGVAFDANGKPSCPKPTKEYEPGCWRAGEIIRDRCLKQGTAPDVCEARAVETRQFYVEAGSAGFRTVSGARPEDWRDSGQCRDCFIPSFNYVPGNAVQRALAISKPGEDGKPIRFTFGVIGSSDNHFARPGTGYKEMNRFYNVEGGGPAQAGGLNDPERDRGAPLAQATRIDLANTQYSAFQLVDVERQASFFMTGGLAVVHSAGRSRDAIWDALQRREVYATSGDRILLWFDLANAPGGTQPMGSEVAMNEAPRFTVKALGAFKQKPGCPEYAQTAIGKPRLQKLCQGECYNPSSERKRITRVEVIRIRRQQAQEKVETLIDDPWKTLTCPAGDAACTVSFEDPEFTAGRRDLLYYVRAIEEPSNAVDGGQLRCERDAEGNCVKVHICTKDYRTRNDDDCLAPIEERAWSSPIYVNYAGAH
jgi:hypothetical protein